jgi:hypothetical protein
MGGSLARLSGARLWVGAGDIEITQCDMSQVVRAACIAQHDFRHQLRPAIGRNRLRRRLFVNRDRRRSTVDRRGGGKNKVAHIAFDRAFNQRAGIDGVVAIIAERITHRIRHDQRGGKVNDGLDIVFADEARHERLIAAFADHERNARSNRPAMSGG